MGNIAHGRGGAFHIEDNPFAYCIFEDQVKVNVRNLCFFQTIAENCDLQFEYTHSIKRDISLNFTNNTATESGDTLYGGNLDICGVCSEIKNYYVLGTTAFKQLTNKADMPELSISSDPVKVCICENINPNCSRSLTTLEKYPGQNLSVSVIAVGQLNGTVPSVIRAVPDGLQLSDEYITQQAENNKKCTKLHYPLVKNTTDVVTTLELYSDEPCSTSGYPLTVQITFLPCPTGFSLSDGVCSCEGKLKQYTQDCYIQNQTFNR